jgi:hypothetical protein
MSVSLSVVRRLALALPGVVELDHWGRPSFRVGLPGARKPKIFATLWPDERRAVVMLKPEQQEEWMESHPGMFAPVHGTWGVMGATFVELAAADQRTVHLALRMAWEKAAPRSLVTGMNDDRPIGISVRRSHRAARPRTKPQ